MSASSAPTEGLRASACAFVPGGATPGDKGNNDGHSAATTQEHHDGNQAYGDDDHGGGDDADDADADNEEMMLALEAEMEQDEQEEHDNDGMATIYSLNNNTPKHNTTSLPVHMVNHAAEFWFPESRNCPCCAGFKHGCQCCQPDSNGGKPRNQACTQCSATANVGNGTTAAASVVTTSAKAKAAPLCRFYRSPGGCRFGENCRFSHE